MSNPKANTSTGNKPPFSEDGRNKAAAPKTQAEFYAHAWTVIFNKLSKEEQEALLINLRKPEPVVRDKSIPFDNVNRFVKNVVGLGEEMFEKSVKPIPAKA